MRAKEEQHPAITRRTRGYLPHWERNCGVYFITFRLADSLPKAIVVKLAEHRRILQAAKNSGRALLPSESVTDKELSSRRFEDLLDSGSGYCVLARPEVAELVVKALEYWNRDRFELAAYCVMPNHVHVVVRLAAGASLSRVVAGWKSFTAKSVNRVLGRSGHLWEREYYDRLIRDDAEFDRAVEYVRLNPVKAGLENWRWMRVDLATCKRILAGVR